MEWIEAIARKHGLRVIYDAAHTLGSGIRKKAWPSSGDASIFSFHATKVFNSIEGGGYLPGGTGWSTRLNCLKNSRDCGPGACGMGRRECQNE